ncbi:MAG: hypothetical protein ACLP1D_05265 [Xanthobacteraceae bacterium]
MSSITDQRSKVNSRAESLRSRTGFAATGFEIDSASGAAGSQWDDGESAKLHCRPVADAGLQPAGGAAGRGGGRGVSPAGRGVVASATPVVPPREGLVLPPCSTSAVRLRISSVLIHIGTVAVLAYHSIQIVRALVCRDDRIGALAGTATR